MSNAWEIMRLISQLSSHERAKLIKAITLLLAADTQLDDFDLSLLEDEIGSFLKSLTPRDMVDFREDAGLTQQALGARIGGGQSSVSKVEQRNDLRVSTLLNYMAALGYEVSIIVMKNQCLDIPRKIYKVNLAEKAKAKRGRRPKSDNKKT